MTIGIDRYYIVKVEVSNDGGGVNSWFIPRLRPQPLWPFLESDNNQLIINLIVCLDINALRSLHLPQL